MKLYEIVGQFNDLYQLSTNEEVDEQTFADTIEALTAELGDKTASYIDVINQLEMEQKHAEEVAAQWKKKAEVRKNSVKRLREALKFAMEQTGNAKLTAGDYEVKIVKNGGKLPIIYSGDVPQDYQKVVYEVDGEKIRAALEGGEELPFASLGERGTRLSIK